MPLTSLVAEIKRNHTAPKQIVYHMPAPRFIDADKASEQIEQQAQEQAQKQAACEDWRDCKYMKEVNNTYYCNHFMSKCACEKCNGKLPLLAKKMR